MREDRDLIPLTLACAERAAELAAQYRLRGTDAVYLAVAEELGTTLTPTEWLAAQMGAGN